MRAGSDSWARCGSTFGSSALFDGFGEHGGTVREPGLRERVGDRSAFERVELREFEVVLDHGREHHRDEHRQHREDEAEAALVEEAEALTTGLFRSTMSSSRL